MLRKKFSAPLDEADLQWLIESGIPEGKTLEYKRDIPDGSDSGKVKFLRAVTAFANTDGGDLIFGLNADGGIARSFSPLEKSTVDSSLLRLESLIASSTEPRLSGVLFHQVPVAAGGSLIVVRVNRSWNAPHRVTVGNHAHFYGRNSVGCYPMDTSELRRAFNFAESFADRVRQFRNHRFSKISSGNFPVNFTAKAKLAIHILPLSSFLGGKQIQLEQQSTALRNLPPPGSRSYDFRYNLDGWLSFSTVNQKEADSYVQVYRNGAIEGVMTLGDAYSNEKILYGWYESHVVEFIENVFRFFTEFGIIPPIYIGLSLADVEGYSIHNNYRYFGGHKISGITSFSVPEVQIDDLSLQPSVFMKDSFDNIWNAFGFPRSFNYTTDGAWSPPT